MKVFLSWSGNMSHKVALVFRDWFPSVIQSIEPYVSSEDIDKGARWSTDIAKELEDSTFGILCVTKENINAPWLTFEAGALSKTMDKSFVSPFLFDIKRSEVDGPILQFQSTIFQKEDIKKLIKTLNKACGEGSIPEARLDKAFEVWYPTLEEELSKIKETIEPVESKGEVAKSSTETENISSEILEEILELARSNQKLLRNPDPSITNGIEKLQMLTEEANQKINRIQDADMVKFNKKFSPMYLEKMMHFPMKNGNGHYNLLLLLSFFKKDFPWVYDIGKELIQDLKLAKTEKEKENLIMEFRQFIEMTFENPMFREMLSYRKDYRMYIKELPYMIEEYLMRLK